MKVLRGEGGRDCLDYAAMRTWCCALFDTLLRQTLPPPPTPLLSGTTQCCCRTAGNPGLAEVVEVLESVHSACAPITRADLYQLAGMMAVEQLGGPHIEFRPGRPDSEQPSPPGRLPVFETCEGGIWYGQHRKGVAVLPWGRF